MRVVILASNAAAASAVRNVMRYAPTCRVIGWVSARRPCAASLTEATPDVVVVDADEMLDLDTTLARVREARQALPSVKIVLLTPELHEAVLNDAAAAGADAAIAKTASSATVAILVREVAAGHVFRFTPSQPARVQAQTYDDTLTTRELEMLRHVAAGLPNSRIATQLWVTEQTVKFHLSNVYRKLGLSNRTEAAHYAYTHGIVEAHNSDPLSVAA